jgi:hypothetical protein
MATTYASTLLFASLVCGSLASLPVTASAEDAPAAPAMSPARALFKEARELAQHGDYQAACPKFEQSLALESGLGTQFNLADCWEHLGRTASAQALFVGAAASAKAAGQADREQVLRDRAAALEPRIPRLVIEVNDPDPKLIVKRGDLPLDSDVYGKAKPVDPGSYEIVAKAPGKKTWIKKVDVAAGSAIVTVAVPKLEVETAEAATPSKDAEKPAPSKEPTPPPAPGRGHGPRLAVYGLAGASVVGFTVGTIMAIKFSNANSDAKAVCPTSVGCSPVQIAFHDERVDEARTARTWTYIGFGVGVVGLGAAAAALFLPQSTESQHAWSATPLVAADGSFGASLSGKF